MSCRQAGLHFHLSERTVYRILGRRLPSGKVRRAQRPGPKPGTGPGMTSPAMVQLVCEWKREHPEKGHAYCHHLLKRQGLNPPAPVTIWRLWRKRNLLGTKRRRQSRSRWHQLREQGAGFFQLDTMYLPGDRFAFCAIDTLSRYAYIEVAESRDGQRAAAFLHRLIQVYPGKLVAVQTDNGAEFHGRFQKLVKKLQLPHYFAWVRCPEQNGMVERFVRTVREESELGAATPSSPTNHLRGLAERFLHYYNHQRLHSRLDWQTPCEYLYHHTHLHKEHLPS